MFRNLFKSPAALYGCLPPEIPENIPEIDTCLIEEYQNISMNAEPEMQDVSISDAVKGTPISWLLRSALAQGRSLQETQRWLMSKRAVRGAFVILASSTEAVWMHIRGVGEPRVRLFF